MNDRQPTILLVDDDKNVLNSLQRVFREESYQILTAGSGKEALEVLEKNEIHLLVSDQKMPGMSGTDLMAIVKEAYPDVFRIILTEFTGVDKITASVENGNVFKFLLKPWDDETLKLEIKQALDQQDLQQTNRELEQRVLEQNEKLRKLDEDLGKLVERRTADFVFQNSALELSRAILDELPVAIIGVSVEGIIALVNQEAQNLSIGEKKIIAGEDIGDYFPQRVRETILTALETQKNQVLSDFPLNGGRYEIRFTPLSGHFRNKGVILTFKPLNHP